MRDGLLYSLIPLVALLSSPVWAEGGTWVGTLQDGSVIRIDPTTHRATRYTPRGASPLWDGIHRLQNGETVIVKDGVVVTNRTVMESMARSPAPEQQIGQPLCLKLVEKVCGRENQCADSPACSPARQLLSLENDEAHQLGTRPGNPGLMETSRQCQEALANEAFFKPCAANLERARPTPCQQLVNKVCGPENQCASSPGCDPAHQLFDMETEEITTAGRGEIDTETGRQCREALTKEDFFAPCEAASPPTPTPGTGSSR